MVMIFPCLSDISFNFIPLVFDFSWETKRFMATSSQKGIISEKGVCIIGNREGRWIVDLGGRRE